MFAFEANGNVIVQQQKAIEAALSTNPKTQEALRKIIRKELLKARQQVIGSISLNSDPRGAARAIRTIVYRQILGGNINIYNSRRAHGSSGYIPPRKGSSGRGGNRRVRNVRTAQMMSYGALDRGFILRWLNSGTKERSIQFEYNSNREADKWNKHPNTGNRGSIAARNFFGGAASRALQQAADNLTTMIETELAAIMNKQ